MVAVFLANNNSSYSFSFQQPLSRITILYYAEHKKEIEAKEGEALQVIFSRPDGLTLICSFPDF